MATVILFCIFSFFHFFIFPFSRTPQFETEVLLPFTPVKNQGDSQLCWAYAMLSTIETEHILQGDSIHLSVAFVERALASDPDAPASGRGMAMTLVNLIQKYGIVPYDAMPTSDLPAPHHAYMFGCEYTPQEFARSICAPDEYVGVGSTQTYAYYEDFEPQLPDNWQHHRLYNLPPDSLLALTEQAIRQRHAVCWEGDISEWGFDRKRGLARTSFWNGTTTDDHCMAIVGIAHDADGTRYFIMKNSWGTANPYGGLVYLSFDYFRQKTVAVFLQKGGELLKKQIPE
jgi:bleomycin hydrolase